jgi:hypothetical protein
MTGQVVAVCSTDAGHSTRPSWDRAPPLIGAANGAAVGGGGSDQHASRLVVTGTTAVSTLPAKTPIALH